MNAIDWLEAAGLVIKMNITNSGKLPFKGVCKTSVFSEKGAKDEGMDFFNRPLKAYSKENAFKLLLFDVGILGSMSHLSPQIILDYSYGSYNPGVLLIFLFRAA